MTIDPNFGEKAIERFITDALDNEEIKSDQKEQYLAMLEEAQLAQHIQAALTIMCYTDEFDTPEGTLACVPAQKMNEIEEQIKLKFGEKVAEGFTETMVEGIFSEIIELAREFKAQV